MALDNSTPVPNTDVNEVMGAAASRQGVNFVEFDQARCLPQTESVLFSSFPGEIRDLIFYYALCDYEDTKKLYDQNTCYRRPGYFAPRRADTALLRTCQRIYREAWFLPWTNREHTFFLTHHDRCPVRTVTQEEMDRTLRHIADKHGETEIEHIRVFPQLYRIEDGIDLQKINDWAHFRPRRFTITIRHTDWWNWESDQPLRIDSRFVNSCRFPDSVRELRFELESIERKKDQINFMAKEMMEKWQFQRKDGTHLSAKNSEISVTEWSGSSTWNGQRWLRDESRADTLDYYVLTIAFTPIMKGSPDEVPEINYSPPLRVENYTPLTSFRPHITTATLEAAQIPPGTAAEDVVRRWDEFNNGRMRMYPVRRPLVRGLRSFRGPANSGPGQ